MIMMVIVTVIGYLRKIKTLIMMSMVLVAAVVVAVVFGHSESEIKGDEVNDHGVGVVMMVVTMVIMAVMVK